MNPIEAVKFLTEAAWKGHTAKCKCLVANGISLRVGDEKLCDCGSVEHNSRVKEALLVIGNAKRKI